ncbi:MAG TPA: copper ion binding protein [Acidimicrobiia bacterium]|jgi:copper chaperone|nr:copper ion binding protein [Acidimicrobiia bacterium]
MIETTLTVPGIHCDHCKSSIEAAVGELDGVAAVNVDIDPKTVEVSFDDDLVSLDRIVGAIEEQGYDVPR